jgi:hypothetical protein
MRCDMADEQIPTPNPPGRFMQTLITWNDHILSSTKRILFVIAVVSSLSFSFGYAYKKGLDAQVVDIIKTVIWATGVAYTGGRFAENWTGK